MADQYISNNSEINLGASGLKAICKHLSDKLVTFKRKDRYFDRAETLSEYEFDSKRAVAKIPFMVMVKALNGNEDGQIRLENILYKFFQDIRNESSERYPRYVVQTYQREEALPGTGAITQNHHIDGMTIQVIFDYDKDYLSTNVSLVCEFKGE